AMAERLSTLAADLANKAGTAIPEERLAQEAAVLATKADVREELDRLRAHILSARELLSSGQPAGRKLDFLAQEFMREANTLCSKAGSMELTNIGLALKSVVDQFKEQVANVE
ncbi:MAG: endoribonuclease YicC domain-containing protein, partial [Alphaproteobacteria bacterium]